MSNQYSQECPPIWRHAENLVTMISVFSHILRMYKSMYILALFLDDYFSSCSTFRLLLPLGLRSSSNNWIEIPDATQCFPAFVPRNLRRKWDLLARGGNGKLCENPSPNSTRDTYAMNYSILSPTQIYQEGIMPK